MDASIYIYPAVNFLASLCYTVALIMLACGKHQKTAAILSVVGMALFVLSTIVLVSLL